MSLFKKQNEIKTRRPRCGCFSSLEVVVRGKKMTIFLLVIPPLPCVTPSSYHKQIGLALLFSRADITTAIQTRQMFTRQEPSASFLRSCRDAIQSAKLRITCRAEFFFAGFFFCAAKTFRHSCCSPVSFLTNHLILKAFLILYIYWFANYFRVKRWL